MSRITTKHISTVVILCVGTVASHDASAQYTRIAGAKNNPAVAGVARTGGARTTVGSASMAGLSKGMAAFSADMGRMPTGAEGLMALIVRPAGAKNWRGPYISTNNYQAPFTDPWGMQYRYTQQVNGRSYLYTIASNGPDRVAGTRDDLQIQF